MLFNIWKNWSEHVFFFLIYTITVYVTTSPLVAAKRSSLIKNTKLAAVAFLNELPRTKHNLTSFALDVSMTTVSRAQFYNYFFLACTCVWKLSFIIISWPSQKEKNINFFLFPIIGTIFVFHSSRTISWRYLSSINPHCS